MTGGPAGGSAAGVLPAGPPDVVPAGAPGRGGERGRLVRDAALTIGTRFGLAILIFATDIILARALGPSAKGRFALVLLYSQLAATLVGLGMDQAIAVVSARSATDARRAVANALVWTAVVGGAAVLASLWLYGVPATGGPPSGPLATLVPNLSAAQFTIAAFAVPAELLFNLGLFVLLGRGRIAAYSAVRLVRRLTLLALLVSTALVTRLDLAAAIVLNLASLGTTLAAIAWAARRDGLLGGRPSTALLGEELRFGGRAVVGTLAERLQFRADAFIVNALAGVRATGIYSVTSGLAETLWYIPNALGIVMFSRAVDPRADAGRTAAVLTRTTLAVSLVLAVPAALLGPRFVRFVYGTSFADAGVALRLIIPGVVAYSVVAILSRYLTGRGRPGAGTLILLLGLGTNIAANLVLVPAYGINGAAAASSLSYGLTAVVIVAVFLRVSGRGLVETLVVRRSDLTAAGAVVAAVARRASARGRAVRQEPPVEVSPAAADLVIGEHSPGEEP
ncbi:MAG TPA: polysaccharide biosynthesis C-terminal domain-containing protein [Candidatus Limnocylindrales bacterium]|nr:polysaccharide biosynthesis C-terminal domain-containing protein [Candidatus Limnocylindrales bacterium]